MTATVPQFHAARCVRYRYRYSECRRCADACPHQAIELSEEGAAVDRTRCQNCALCTSACRTAALVPGNLPRLELLKRAIRQERFSFGCAPSGCETDAVVPCLGALDAPTLAYLGWRGIATELRGSHHCQRCPHGAKGEAQLAANLEGVASLGRGSAMERWAPPTLSVSDDAEGARDFRPNRRQFFRRLAGRGLDGAMRTADAPPDTPVPEQAIRAGAWSLPEARELLHIVCQTRNGEAFPVASHDAVPLMRLELASGCTACEACFRVCPTGAIQVRESPEEWALAFDVDRCVGCGVCLEVCQLGVLRSSAAFDAAPKRPPMVLLALRKQRCERCDRFFASREPKETCAVCAQDEDCFAEIFG